MDVAAIPLTSLSHGAGCGCKLPAAALLPIVRGLPAATAPELLVGSATGDDAAVWRISDELALVQTVDFFTPVVDDPYDFGRIAAANAFSDVYAMGGRPLTALNLVAWPVKELPLEQLARVLEGGADVARAAGGPAGPDQAAGPRHHHDRGEAGGGHPGTTRAGRPDHDHAERGGLGGDG